jgi:LuxR family transcriptional regulator, maltose regulon positive regulatory protein
MIRVADSVADATMCLVQKSERAAGHASAVGGGRRILRRGLFGLLEEAERVTLVSAPAGSGKTSLVQSWISATGLADRTAWVSVGRGERDPQTFWLSVLDALRATRPGSRLVRELTAAPGLDGATVVQRLREDLRSLREPLWLVIDDLHELEADDAVGPLEVLLSAPLAQLRFVLLTRVDVRLGLHRLRIEGELTEVRSQDILFTLEEARELFEAAGVRMSEDALKSLLETTEGWAAGLRLAALSLAHHPDPERFAAGFSGRERGVAEYLLAEVLARQPEEMSRLLLLTSVLERVSAPLADRLTGRPGSERILLELEDAGAFVVALDEERSWFRYHHLFADLLALELRRTMPDQLTGLHTIAADWFAEHGYPADAIRHAQAAENWGLAARLLADNWVPMYLGGRLATARELMSRFPPDMVTAKAELAALAAGDRRAAGSVHEAERYLALATRLSASLPGDRRERFEVLLALQRLTLARARNDLQAVAEEAERLVATVEAPEAIQLGLGEDLRTMALTDLGSAEIWAGRLEDAERHLDRGLAEARRTGRPLLELQALAHLALLSVFRSQAIAAERAKQAVDVARKHGWEETASAVATAYLVLGSVALWRGQLEEVGPWLDRTDRVLRQFAQPTVAALMYAAQALLAFARGRHAEALDAARVAQSIERELVTRHFLETRQRALNLVMLVHVGETERVQQALSEMNEEIRDTAEMRIVLGALRLTQDDPQGTVSALAAILEGSTPMEDPRWSIQALLLDAIASDALRDPGGASRSLERALDLAEPDGLLLPFLLFPAPALVEQHRRLGTPHAALIHEILNLLSGRAAAAQPDGQTSLREPLSDSELRVLRYLPTTLQASEISAELFVSVNTVRTHIRHLYAKLEVHKRADAVKRARELGLLSPER